MIRSSVDATRAPGSALLFATIACSQRGPLQIVRRPRLYSTAGAHAATREPFMGAK